MIGLDHVAHGTGSRPKNCNDDARIFITGAFPDKITDFKRLGHYSS
jgi:hypothetical protein